MHADRPGHRPVQASPDAKRAVATAFIVAVFGWGVGFYGLPVYLHAVVARTGWPATTVSAAVTFHFLAGAAAVWCLPRVYARWGVARTTAAGSLLLAGGALGWSLATTPWHLFIAATVSGTGWAAMGAAAINALVPVSLGDARPAALALAYNGASLGGVIFSPLWSLLTQSAGFQAAAAAIGAAMACVVIPLALVTPGNAECDTARRSGASSSPLPASRYDVAFVTLAAAMTLGLFAQIGLIAHLYSLLQPQLGPGGAGWAMGCATGCAVLGRSLATAALRAGRSPRQVAAACYAVQVAGCALLSALFECGWLVLPGVVLFGLGIGNATSLPPLIAQRETIPAALQQRVARVVAISQAGYAFAPAAFGWVMILGTDALFATAAAFQLSALACLLSGSACGDTRPQ